MGNRRIGRKRLYGVEKQGQSIDLQEGAGISACIGSATQHRQGQEIITEITVDLNPAAQANATKLGTGAGKVIGKTTTNSYITRLTVAKYGIITEIRGIVLEALTDASDAAVDVDLVTDDNVRAQADAPAAQNTVVVDSLSTLGEDVSNSNAFSATMQNSDEAYLYICNGDGEGKGTMMKTGKILIYIHGFEVPADA